MVIGSKQLVLIATIGLTALTTGLFADASAEVGDHLSSGKRLRGRDAAQNSKNKVRNLEKTLQKPPLARDDVTETPLNTAVTIAVLKNDKDVEGDALTISSLTEPAHGSAKINAGEGTITYTPNTDFVGADSFFYTNTDGSDGFGIGRVIVTVLPPPNTDPSAKDVVDVTTLVNTAITIPVLDNDVDPDGDTITVHAVTIPSDGTATINEVEGTITYTPNLDFVGTDRFAYLVSDIEGGTDTAVVEVKVVEASSSNVPDHPPVAVDDTATTVKGTPVVIAVLENDFDANVDDVLSIISFDSPRHGTISVDLNEQTIRYSPNGVFVGTERFSYSITDGKGGTATALVSVEVTATNAPPIAQDDTATTQKNTPVFINVLQNDSDPDDGDKLLIVSVDDAASEGAVLINKMQRAVTYLPATDFVGTDTFQYTIEDTKGDTATATVTVEVKETQEAGRKAAP